MDHCVQVSVKFSGQLRSRIAPVPGQRQTLTNKMRLIHVQYLPHVLDMKHYSGRLLVIGDSGSGRRMLTKQLFSEVAQRQLLDLSKQTMLGRMPVSSRCTFPLSTGHGSLKQTPICLSQQIQ